MSKIEGKTGSARQLEELEHRLADIKEELALREADLAVKSREVEESTAHQAATAEVLAIISKSPSNVQPVLDKIATIACRLCEADHASIYLVRDGACHLKASLADPEFVELLRNNPLPLNSNFITARAANEKRVMHIPDVKASRSDFDLTLAVRSKSGSLLSVPLQHDGEPVGAITIGRRRAQAFADNHIELVKTFADQAVIAVENVRQFKEIQIRLKHEEATSEILQVISRSRDDEQPVFDVILENATRLCDAPLAYLRLCNEERTQLEIAAHSGTRTEFINFVRDHPLPLDGTQSATARAVLEMTVIQTADLADDPLYRDKQPHRVQAVDVEGMRTLLNVPLIAGDKAIGVIALYRREVRVFDERQIELVRTFAAQAVIAIQNVRQFKALERLNAELGDRVEEQVGEIERMGRLKRFLPSAVADTVVSQGSDKMLSSHRALLGVLFCDIRGFTAFCETAEPEETIEVLQTYHEEMGKLINAYGAGVDHRTGDGIMVLFNDPLPCNDPAGDAVRLAIAMRERMAELGVQWKRLGYRLGFGVGVSLGYATVGMVGFEGRFDYTASGTAINLAARLCDEADDGEILLSPRAGIAVEDAYQVETKGKISLKGIREPLEVFRLTGAAAT